MSASIPLVDSSSKPFGSDLFRMALQLLPHDTLHGLFSLPIMAFPVKS
jgi:hypothetical protein